MKSILLPAIVLLGTTFSLFSQNRFYVNSSANGQDNGQSWSDAFSNLHKALEVAQPGDSVWVAEGVYTPAISASRDSSFDLPSGVRLFGGFAGTESNIAQRDWQTHLTVLSGDIGIVGDSTDNAYTILYLLNPDSGTVVDGLIFRHGIADNPESGPSVSSPKKCGGAMYIMAANGWAYPDIQNCLFEYNYAFQSGGAVYVNGEGVGSIAPRFLNCTFRHNRARINGGGVYRNGSSWVERSPDFGGCVFEQNWANWRGGGLYFYDRERTDTMELVDCIFLKNTVNVAEGGGAVFNLSRVNEGSKLVIKSCSFQQNSAPKGASFATINFNFLYTGLILIVSSVFIEDTAQTNNLIWIDDLDLPSSNFTVEGSKFLNNRASGGLMSPNFNYGNSYIRNNEFVNNSMFSLISVRAGEDAEAIIENNRAVSKDGIFAHFNAQSNAVCRNNTIKVKSVVALYPSLEKANAWFDNNIIERTGTLQDLIRYDSSASKVYFSHCLLDTTWYCSGITRVVCGTNNLFNLDPQFRDTANNDYSLLPCSPLINAGSNAAAMGILTDIEGNPRIQSGTVDIGAYESPGFALAASPEVQPACVGSSNGSIAIMPVFGCEPYTYNWLPDVGNGPQLNGLLPGNYLLTITDGSGRQILDTVQVASAPLPVLNPLVTDVHCGTTLGGSIAANVNNGTAPFHYQWQPLAADTSLLTRLSPGAYSLTVLDANGCQDSASASIALMGMITLMVDGQTISCYGQTDGWLSATPATGAAPFSWLWQGWPGTDSIAQPLSPGSYAVTVSDAYGCTASFAFPIMTEPGLLSATVGISDQTDLNMPNGAAVVTTISGGTSPFGYEWNTGSTLQAIAGLTAGTYCVTVTDEHGCETVNKVIVQLMVGTSEADGQALMMYPNPAADWLKIVLPARHGLSGGHAGQDLSGGHAGQDLSGGPSKANERRIELADASGRVVLKARIPAGDNIYQMDLSGLPGGSYLVTVYEGSGEMFVGRVVKR